jgi:DNA-binding XRE family transcriptional regulator
MSDISGFKIKRRTHASTGNDPILLALGDKIRMTRAEAGMTQEELALVTGIGRERIMQIENGKPGVSIGAVSRVLNALGLKLVVMDR